MFIVKYCGGGYDNYYTNNIFVTNNKSKATKYVTRFNNILKKWRKHYDQFEHSVDGTPWIKDEFADQHFNRWNSLRDINRCYMDEVEFR